MKDARAYLELIKNKLLNGEDITEVDKEPYVKNRELFKHPDLVKEMDEIKKIPTKDKLKDKRIEDLSREQLENLCFHSTKESNLTGLDRISRTGLKPTIGENSAYETHPKVCFTKGITGIGIMWDGIIQYYIYENELKKEIAENEDLKTGQIDTEEKKFIRHQIETVVRQRFMNKELNTKEHFEASYAKIYNDLKNNVYLKCDIIEGKEEEGAHYSKDAEDEKKARASFDNSFQESYRGHLAPINKSTADFWDLRTFPGRGIEPERLELLSANGSTNVFDVVRFCLDYINKEDNNHELAGQLKNLEGFLEYAEKQRKMEIQASRGHQIEDK